MTKDARPILSYSALLFDLDGVITPTADLHRAAWREMFSEFLDSRSAKPYEEQDYFDYLDGRRRDEGVAALLTSRNIELELGTPDDSAAQDTIHGLGARKNEKFLELLAQGIDAYEGSVDLLDAVAAVNPAPRIAIVSSSKNAKPVLEAAGLSDRFELIVDGIVAKDNDLAGKPAPDTYVYAADQLGIPVAESVVVEDATSGVASGKAGNFSLVVGVDRGAGAEALRKAGADVVVSDLAELLD
ncbi:HAD family hydrolase [Corynebacterium heidelbergense]|uniref:Haloacid dehalogenase n=1 Tax=Corynebacterium heidelbergense TaxID=2055947 RepID=A0A364VEE0_9CORY|nr:HAD-IA family hydrolase [Corynebacterium heidelbergense]RAV35015.1 hypothetical protein CWC39_00120 [Corynebacterium heidelbergense]WCZ37439.1 putative glycosyl hydrolase [Corynebacterium heidelbergense]